MSTTKRNILKISIALLIITTALIALFIVSRGIVYSENERANWPVFENTQLGYSISYPQGWFYHTGGFLPPNTVIFTQSESFNPEAETEASTPHISLTVKDLKEESPTEDLDEYINLEASELRRGSASDEKFGEHDVRRLRRQAAGTESEVEMFYIKRGQRLIRIGVFPAQEESIEIAKEMIKTLKFNNGQNP